jgi:hypothetical protein
MRRPRARESEVAGVSKGFDAVLREAFDAGVAFGVEFALAGTDSGADEAYAEWRRELAPSRDG